MAYRLLREFRQAGYPPRYAASLKPPSPSFDHSSLERGLAQKVGGTVTLDFRPESLECHIGLPMMGAEKT